MKKITFFALVLLCIIGFSCKSGRGHRGGVHNNFCLTGETKIALHNGTATEIRRVKTGDLVMSFNAETGKTESAIVLEMKKVKHDNIVTLSFETAQVNITDDHPIWVKGKGWASLNPKRSMSYLKLEKVSLLQLGDVCLFINSDGTTGESQLMKMELVPGEFDTYTITKLSRNKAFFANGIMVAAEEIKTDF
jgi:hypothetical protein